MRVTDNSLPGVVIIEPRVFEDLRGCFVELYHHRRYSEEIGLSEFVQDNFSRSQRGTIRGLHYQIQETQGKLVWVTHGEVFDVMVDLRCSSPTFGKVLSAVLDDRSFRQLYIPPGFAHGFCTVSDYADMMYKCTAHYAPEHERTILWNDPELNIQWPISEPLISEKDQRGLLLKNAPTFP